VLYQELGIDSVGALEEAIRGGKAGRAARDRREDRGKPRIRTADTLVTGRGDVVAVLWPQVPGPVGTMLVTVRDVLVQDRPEVLALPSDVEHDHEPRQCRRRALLASASMTTPISPAADPDSIPS